MCREGRLYDVERWIGNGKPLQLAPDAVRKGTRPKTALKIALESGQHSLAFLLLRSGYRLEPEGYAPLDTALQARRWDLFDLLLEWGASEDEDRFIGCSAMEEAASQGHLVILGRLGPDPARDDFDHVYQLAKYESIIAFLATIQRPKDLTPTCHGISVGWMIASPGRSEGERPRGSPRLRSSVGRDQS